MATKKSVKRPVAVPEVEHVDHQMYDNRCVACNRPVRVYPREVERRMACPYCHTVIMVVEYRDDLGMTLGWARVS